MTHRQRKSMTHKHKRKVEKVEKQIIMVSNKRQQEGSHQYRQDQQHCQLDQQQVQDPKVQQK
jgi:hypothetical protein